MSGIFNVQLISFFSQTFATSFGLHGLSWKLWMHDHKNTGLNGVKNALSPP